MWVRNLDVIMLFPLHELYYIKDAPLVCSDFSVWGKWCLRRFYHLSFQEIIYLLLFVTLLLDFVHFCIGYQARYSSGCVWILNLKSCEGKCKALDMMMALHVNCSCCIWIKNLVNENEKVKIFNCSGLLDRLPNQKREII